jgi:tRNA threonylcarbamoyladenosine dehydratase
MDSFLARLNGPSARLLIAVLASSSITALAIYSFQSLRREHALSSVKAEAETIAPTQIHRLNSIGAEDLSVVPAKEAQIATKAKRGQYDEELIMEQLARNRTFFGDEGLSRIRKGFVIVVGVGGVGSWATTMLARSGVGISILIEYANVGRIRVIDFDQVTLSSLNRHASATLASVGTPKATSLCSFLETIAPFVKYEPIIDLWTLETAGPLLEGEPDYIIDCIDNISTKIDLLAYCHEHNLRVLSSMGSGCKSDPTRVQIGDISETTEDPLSRSTRRGLRARGIDKGIQVVFSTERPSKDTAKLLPLDEEEFQKGNVNELSSLPNFRVRILPVVGLSLLREMADFRNDAGYIWVDLCERHSHDACRLSYPSTIVHHSIETPSSNIC